MDTVTRISLCKVHICSAFQLMESQAEGLTAPELQELHQLPVSSSDIVSIGDGDI